LEMMALYLRQDTSVELRKILDRTAEVIDGFESPLGMELLATVDWLLDREHADATVPGIRDGMRNWPAGAKAAERKLRLFNDRLIEIALHRLAGSI
ncbi:MAG: hypothetical protein ACRD1E_05675, partial [Terriglobales bacterium]